jgi:hypothetical protein
MENPLHAQVSEHLIARFFVEPLIPNIWRSDYVEGLVLFSLGKAWKQPPLWSGWDLENDAGVRLEVKQSAALQSWYTQTGGKRSRPSFDIAPRTGYYTDSTDDAVWVAAADLSEADFIRSADIYIFAWHPETDPKTADHRRAEQWRFFVVPEYLLTERHGPQKTITLNPIKRLSAAVIYDRLASTVDAAVSKLRYFKADLSRQDAEDYYQASKILEKVREGREKVYSAEEVMAYLELDR